MYWFLLISLATVVAARQSPNADYVATLKSTSEATYSNDVWEDAGLDVPSLITKYGYPVEIHHVITSDGYILEAHRIPHGRLNNNQMDSNKPVVFLMHGLLSSSADFLVLGPENALGYLLAEAGYDVWFGNARGNFYSRNHISLDPGHSNQNFWKFSWDEIGNYDLPAFIDYIQAKTGQNKLHYIGHSQGGTAFLVLNSLRPEYNERFISFQALAPASFFTHNENSLFKSLAPLESIIESAAWTLGYGEIFSNPEFITRFEDQFCRRGSLLQPLCGSLGNLAGMLEHYNETLVPVILGHAPAGASVRQVAHYGQVMRYDAFRRYNHNMLTNLATYGRITPPEYDLSRVTVPAYIHFGLSDAQVDYRDIFKLATKLFNTRTVETFQVENEIFNHFDFIWGNNVRTILYEKLLGCLKDAESRFL